MSNKLNLLKIMSSFLFFLPLSSYGQTPSLTYLVEKALEKNYDLANKELSISSELETQKSIKEAYLPRLEASGKYAYVTGDLTVDLPSTSLPLLNIPLFEESKSFNSSTNLWTADLTASMLLFSGTKVPKLNKAIEQKIKGQTLLLENDRQEIIDQVSQAYDQLALLKQVNIVLNESEQRLEEEKKTANKAFEYGLITSFEKNKIEVAQAALDAKKQEFLGKKSLLLSQLNQLTGVPLNELAMIDESLSPYALINKNDNIDNRPEIAALDAAIKANRFKIEAEKTHWIPKIQAIASAKYLGLTNSKLKTPYNSPVNNTPIEFRANRIEAFPIYFVGVGFKWDLFDGFKGKREVNKAKIELQQTENNQKKVNELLTLNLEKAKIDYEVANKQMESGIKRKEMAEKALNIASKEYNIGLIKPSDRIIAENDFQQAALDYLQSVFNQRRAAFNYLKATGTLTIDKL
jgi:outer membrane protein TolC